MAAVPVNDRVRVEPGVDGAIVVMAAWCGKCKCEVMPLGDGHCPWCRSRIVDESQLSASAMLSQLRDRGPVGLGKEAALDRPAEAESVGAVGAVTDKAASSSSPKPGPVEPAPTPEGAPDRAGGGARTFGRGELQSAVLAELGRGLAKPAEITAAIGKSDSKIVWQSLRILLEKGLAANVAHGVWEITDKGRAQLASSDSLDVEASEREPQAEEDAADIGAALERPASPPTPAGEEAASRSEIGPLDLVRLIEDIDTGAITVTRWKNGDGDQDEATEQQIRQIMRDSLGGWCASEIGEAVIEYIDREVA